MRGYAVSALLFGMLAASVSAPGFAQSVNDPYTPETVKKEHPLGPWLNIEGEKVLDKFWEASMIDYCLAENNPDPLEKEMCADYVSDSVARAREYGLSVTRSDFMSPSFMKAVLKIEKKLSYLVQKWSGTRPRQRRPYEAFKEEQRRVEQEFLENHPRGE